MFINCDRRVTDMTEEFKVDSKAEWPA